NAARMGGGIRDPAPRTDFQITSLSSYSGARSASSRFIAAEAAAPHASGPFFSVSDTRALRDSNTAEFGTGWNAPYIGVAAASYWLIGGKPRMSSMVRSIPEVV